MTDTAHQIPTSEEVAEEDRQRREKENEDVWGWKPWAPAVPTQDSTGD